MSTDAVLTKFSKAARSSVGLKSIAALTGAGLLGFVIIHLLGNLQMYIGQDQMNSYAHALKHSPILWPARIGLLAIFVIHIGATVRLKARSNAARPQGYVYEDTVQASWASRHMIYTGFVLLGFVLYHLAHFTVHLTNPEFATLTDSMGRHDAYNMFVMGFSNPLVSGIYILSMVVLGLHLSHGIQSLFQSMGANNSQWRPLIQKIGLGLTMLIVLGNISMPIAVMAGIIKPAG